MKKKIEKFLKEHPDRIVEVQYNPETKQWYVGIYNPHMVPTGEGIDSDLGKALEKAIAVLIRW